jgi:hypothetical protein
MESGKIVFLTFIFPRPYPCLHPTLVRPRSGGNGDAEASQLDVKFAPLYLSFLNVVKVLMTVTLTLYSDTPAGVLGVCLFSGVALFVWTLVFGRLTGTEVHTRITGTE